VMTSMGASDCFTWVSVGDQNKAGGAEGEVLQ
jgi:hypothetical protein